MCNKPSLKLIIDQELCTGCGVCTLISRYQLSMKWNKHGFLIPDITGYPILRDDCLKVCPFNPNPEKEVYTEDEIAGLFLKDAPNREQEIGQYYNIYAGYSLHHRPTSSSGGIATYILTQLLKQGIVRHVISVRQSEGENSHYEYRVSSTIQSIESSARTKYYPVTMADTLEAIRNLDGKVAITGVGCFVKALRLLQHYEPYWKDKIAFIVGIICGGEKSSFFADYLADKAGSSGHYSQPQFRIKDIESTATDYSYSCTDENGETHQIKMKQVGDMWGSGLFKNNACDFCDDVTTELADISLGDAWIAKYSGDGRGTNVIVTRSRLADNILKNGAESGDLVIHTLTEEAFLSSQQGSINHRHKGIEYRIKHFKKQYNPLPPKRHHNSKIGFDFKLVQKQRLIVRKKSFKEWEKYHQAAKFDHSIKKPLKRLQQLSRLNHFIFAMQKRIQKIF